MMWTEFYDMHSGGAIKVPPYQYIYIESNSLESAERIMADRFKQNADHVTCACCGNDYSVMTGDDLSILTRRWRGCLWDESINGWLEQQSDKD